MRTRPSHHVRVPFCVVNREARASLIVQDTEKVPVGILLRLPLLRNDGALRRCTRTSGEWSSYRDPPLLHRPFGACSSSLVPVCTHFPCHPCPPAMPTAHAVWTHAPLSLLTSSLTSPTLVPSPLAHDLPGHLCPSVPQLFAPPTVAGSAALREYLHHALSGVGTEDSLRQITLRCLKDSRASNAIPL